MGFGGVKTSPVPRLYTMFIFTKQVYIGLQFLLYRAHSSDGPTFQSRQISRSFSTCFARSDLLSSLCLHLPPQRHEHQTPNTQESEFQPDIAGHSHVYPCTSPNRAQNPTGIVAVLNEQANLPIP
jgi:hypothetical protein